MSNNKSFGFILHGQPRTKKNSARMFRNRACLLPSEAYMKYEAACRRAIDVLRSKTQLPHYCLPVRLTCRYWLESKKNWPDLTGLMQATADIISDEYKIIRGTNGQKGKRVLTKQWLLSDDCIIRDWNGTEIVGIDKERPRAEIIITPLETSLETEINPYVIRQLTAQTGLFK